MNDSVPPQADHSDSVPAPCTERRRLTAWDWAVRVPFGFLWLAILVVIAVPICLYMTILYHVIEGVKLLFGRRRSRTEGRGDAEQRAA